MNDKEQINHEVIENKLIVILRGLTEDELIKTVGAMERGGVRMVEVTFDQSGETQDSITAENIAALKRSYGKRVRIGAGTVMTVEQVKLAYAAGAEFIISPDCYEPVIRLTSELGMVSIPGAFSPTEAANAHRWGADFVKLFPNSEVGITYLKALRAPLSHIRFLAVGGVNPDNIVDYINAGAVGVGVSSGIVDKKLIHAGDYDGITRLSERYTKLISSLKR